MSFKYEKDMEYFHWLHPVLKSLVVGCVIPWLVSNGVDEPVITRTFDDMIEGVSETDIHADFRALDMRTYDWTDGLARKTEKYFNNKFAELYGAISFRDGKKRFVVFETTKNKRVQHLHFQVSKGLPFDQLIKDLENGRFASICF